MSIIKKYKLPKTLVLNYRTWRCGGGDDEQPGRDPNTIHGTGPTQLLNGHGFKCCLGQFACQAGVPAKAIKNVGGPDGLLKLSPVDEEVEHLVVGLNERIKDTNMPSDSSFSCQAMTINDDEDTTIAQKAKKLRSLCSKYKRRLILKNFPLRILKEIYS